MHQFRLGPLLFAIALLLGASPADAQPRVIGVLTFNAPEERKVWDQLLGGGLRDIGYRDGKSLSIEYRFAHGELKRYPELAKDLITRRPELIIAPCGPSQRAIREVAPAIPIIALCADPVNFLGEVASLSRPGGNTTGILSLSAESIGKRLQILKELNPRLSRLAVIHDANDPIPAIWDELERLRPRLGLTLQRVPVAQADALNDAFAAMVRERAEAAYVVADNRMIGAQAQVAEFARKYRITTISDINAYADNGGLLTYGASIPELLGKIIPMYADRILKGAKAGDLPIVQPSLFELIVNLKAAREIGVKIPQSVLARADRVIE